MRVNKQKKTADLNVIIVHNGCLLSTQTNITFQRNFVWSVSSVWEATEWALTSSTLSKASSDTMLFVFKQHVLPS